MGKLCHTKIFSVFSKRECFRSLNGRGLMVHIYEKGMETITGTLLVDFFCVTPSCVTAVSDNSVCRSCYFPSCYCVVLQYPAPMSDTLFLMRLAWRVFSFFLPHQDRTQPLKQAGEPLIWVIAWVIVGVVMTQRRRALFVCVCKQKGRKWKGAGAGGSRRERGRETSPLLSLRWDFYGWVSLVRATNT